MQYNFREIEKKWQAFWKEKQVFKADNKSDKPKYYVLDMFPYPSGAGLHVGHPLGYIASDIITRYKRHKGFNVLHPMGFDAFGLPAEQYAIQTGQHPAKTTAENIKRYKEQLEGIGFSYDWSREVQTCDPKYYKWTQWIFIQLFNSWYDKSKDKAQSIEVLISTFEKEGNTTIKASNHCDIEFTAEEWKRFSRAEKEDILQTYRMAYLAYATVNWCPELGTVLANDEVKDGRSERGGFLVERIKMRQWFLRITAYADRLLSGLDGLDWGEPLKEMQRNWIGRSEGAEIDFQIENSKESIKVFTTRPDTIFGATFMVLAPEHELVESLISEEQREEVEKYLAYVKSRTDVERQQEKKVTGVFTGSYTIHPFSGNKVPIYLAEYVLAGYGTGAIMAVPSDDERDLAFAEKFGLKVVQVIDRSSYPNAAMEDKVGVLINSDFLNGKEIKHAIQEAIGALEKLGIGKGVVNFRLRDAGFSRQRYWGEPFPIVYKDGIPVVLDEKDLPVELPEVKSYEPTGDGKAPIASNTEWTKIDSNTEREVDTMPGYAGSSWYFLRYMDSDNDKAFVGKEAESYWQDVDLYIGGAEHAVGHLMYSRFWHKFLYDKGLVSKSEPFKKLINQGMIQGRSNFVYRSKDGSTFVSHGLRKEHNASPIHVDVNIVKNDILDLEAFKASRKEYQDAKFILENGVYKCGYEVEKMSKSKFNVVNPDTITEQFGADTLRLYEMFLGPLEQHKPWDTNGIDGVFKFLKKLWALYHDENNEFQVSDEKATAEELKTLHKTIKKFEDDMSRFSFNTVVSAFMICVNELQAMKCNKREILDPLTILLEPYAPHIAEELYHKLGHEAGSLTNAEFPIFNESHLVEDSFEYPVSVNGKLRTKISFALDADAKHVEKTVMEDEIIKKWLEGKAPKKFIFVKGRIINLVI